MGVVFESSLKEGAQFESGLDSGLNPVSVELALFCCVLLKTLVSCWHFLVRVTGYQNPGSALCLLVAKDFAFMASVWTRLHCLLIRPGISTPSSNKEPH